MMENLAGHVGCDKHIERELRHAGIPMETVEKDTRYHEVPFTIIGRLGVWTFTRVGGNARPFRGGMA